MNNQLAWKGQAGSNTLITSQQWQRWGEEKESLDYIRPEIERYKLRSPSPRDAERRRKKHLEAKEATEPNLYRSNSSEHKTGDNLSYAKRRYATILKWRRKEKQTNSKVETVLEQHQ